MLGQPHWGTQGNDLPVVFYQGSTVCIDALLTWDGTPVDLGSYSVEFILKKAIDAQNALYRVDVTDMRTDMPLGHYRVKIPLVVSNRLPAGVYYHAFQMTQKDTGIILPPVQGSFRLELSPFSPRPRFSITDGEPTTTGENGAADALRTPAELTGPDSPDIGRPF